MLRENRRIKERSKAVYIYRLQRQGKISTHINENGYVCYDPDELKAHQKTHKRGRPPKITKKEN